MSQNEDTGAIPPGTVVLAFEVGVAAVEKYTAAELKDAHKEVVEKGIWDIAKALDEHVDEAVDLDGNTLSSVINPVLRGVKAFLS